MGTVVDSCVGTEVDSFVGSKVDSLWVQKSNLVWVQKSTPFVGTEVDSSGSLEYRGRLPQREAQPSGSKPSNFTEWTRKASPGPQTARVRFL